MNNETHEDRVKILSEAPDGADEVFYHKGSLQYIDNHENGHQFKIWCNEGNEWVFSELVDDWQYIRLRRSLSDIQQLVDMQNDIDELKEELEQYRNRKNWTRSYDCYGKLINQHALFIPRLK